jgi:hypothetical protein
MKERPILFSAPMVRAILDGRKTQTRRIVKDRRPWAQQAIPKLTAFVPSADRSSFGMKVGYQGDPLAGHVGTIWCPYGAPGDRLWVRETFGGDDICGYAYRADHPEQKRFEGDGEQPDSPWRPSIHMPRAASRILLEVTDVHAERLQDISEDDARAEGVEAFARDAEGDCWTDGKHRTALEYLWGQINGPDSWARNPWVWVVGFQRVQP